MKLKNGEVVVTPDYEAIKSMSHSVDCTICSEDFNTSRPNPHRLDYAVSDIHRYMKYSGGKFYEFELC